MNIVVYFVFAVVVSTMDILVIAVPRQESALNTSGCIQEAKG